MKRSAGVSNVSSAAAAVKSSQEHQADIEIIAQDSDGSPMGIGFYCNKTQLFTLHGLRQGVDAYR